MFTEKIIQISDHRLLTNKGRVFEEFIGYDGKRQWTEVDLPNLADKFLGKVPSGKSKFIEAVSDKEKFDNAKNINDLLE